MAGAIAMGGHAIHPQLVPHCDGRFGMPSPEALQLATDAIRRRCLLPETMQHPMVKSECISLAYFIQAYGLCLQGSVPHDRDINRLVAPCPSGRFRARRR